MYKITEKNIEKAHKYAESIMNMNLDRYAFSGNTPEARYQRFFVGGLAEAIFAQFIQEHNIQAERVETLPGDKDRGDFILPNGHTIDVKCFRRPEQDKIMIPEGKMDDRKKIYVVIRLNLQEKEGYVVGWCYGNEFIKSSDFGYGLTYYVDTFKPITSLFNLSI